MKKILVSRAVFPDVIERLARYFDVESNQADEMYTRAELGAKLADKDGAFVAGNVIDASVLEQAPRLRVVSNMAVGYNNFDMDAFTRAGVLATNTPNVLNETTADLGWALMMAAARRMSESERLLRSGAWDRWSYDMLMGVDIHGATLGVIGMGRIGQAVARRAKGFGMRVVYYNRSRVAPEIERELNAEYVDKATLLRTADHIVLVLPYTPESHHTIGAAELAQMKPTATLTNIARGGIVDDAALVEALRERRIGAAGLDVFEGEPKLHPGFLDLPNVVLTPHIGSATLATRRAMANLAADNLIAGLNEGPQAGHPPTPINPEVMARWSAA
ncbi:2-hydroxyacid dehydrogenase [Pararobbsia silviterrae]|uniref:D-glycerate dehydrogenase n=1 Tax=Pararobbsia silviterrae TaxID=1792498 RepID=A0A494Y131_9BURK|nr:D-glycerate dehydrogenase [Pararobbsia silviterrae]RKP56474.1 D-glycerate dehydrogenase [Pararobbsia silviterrae]